MDFILFLIFAGITFYFNKIKPRLEQQRTEAVETAKPAKIIQPKQLSVKTYQSIQKQTKRANRPSDPILLGIEITAAQQRRLGKNDPSVLAAQRAKYIYQEQEENHSLFKHMSSRVEHILKQVNYPAQQHKQLTMLQKMFENLFSK